MQKKFCIRIAALFICSIFVFGAVGYTPSLAVATEKVLIVAPHEDDEVLAFGGIIKKSLNEGKDVKVVLMTNGDYEGGKQMGIRRIAESVNALTFLGVPAGNIMFLGFGDTGWKESGLINPSFLAKLYFAADPNRIFSSNVGKQTYGNPGINANDFHTNRYGVAGDYNRKTLVGDLQTVIDENRPKYIYTTSLYDYHWDHRATYLFTNEVVVNIKKNDPTYSPFLCQSIVHGITTSGSQDNSWPVLDKDPTPLQPFTQPGDLAANSILDWNSRETVTMPAGMDTVPRSSNLKQQTIQKYESQMSAAYMLAFVKSDEFYWKKDFSNIAINSTITASSENISTKQTKDKVADGICDGNQRFADKEWVTNAELNGAWIQLNWQTSHRVNKIVLYDRPNTTEQIKSATLAFSDGSTIAVGELPNNGAEFTINFPSKDITWVKLTVNQCIGKNIGLSEFEVYEG